MSCVIPGDYFGRYAATIAHRKPVILGPAPDFGAVPTMRRCPPLDAAYPARCLTGAIRELAENLIELLTVPYAEIDLVIPAVEAERTHHVLAVRNLFRIVVAGECN